MSDTERSECETDAPTCDWDFRSRRMRRTIALGYLAILTTFLVLPDAWQFLGSGGKEVERQVDATFADLVQHASAYLGLSLLMSAAFVGQRSLATIMLFCAGHGAVTEIIQVFVPNRYYGLSDLMANIFGVCLGVGLLVLSRSLFGQGRIVPACLIMFLCLHGCGEPDVATTSTRDVTELPQARLIDPVSWIGEGEWLKVDTHVHTRFSDGAHDVHEVLAKARDFGCDAVAITDHIDRLDAEDIPVYLDAIELARRQFPELLVIVGLEWNVPPGGGDEHATVLFPDSLATIEVLTEFCERFDDYGREDHNVVLAIEAIRWLEDLGGDSGLTPVVSLNHPSRKRDQCEEVADYYAQIAAASPVLIGFSGAPGHQAGRIIGAYDGSVQTVDHWDPMVLPNSVWDTLLRSRSNVWGALAPSDFHRRGGDEWGDYWPGEFSETWVYAAERSIDAILRGLRRGTFFADHGGIIRDVELTVNTQGLERPAYAGEAIELPAGQLVKITVTAHAPTVDLQGEASRVDDVEILLVTATDVQTKVFPCDRQAAMAVHYKTILESDVIAVRARGRRLLDDGPDLMFYTNPVRIISDGDRAADAPGDSTSAAFVGN